MKLFQLCIIKFLKKVIKMSKKHEKTRKMPKNAQKWGFFEKGPKKGVFGGVLGAKSLQVFSFFKK